MARVMKTMTFDQTLSCVEKLPPDEQEMLAELLRKRRIEAWRNETAAEARKAARAYRSRKLKAESADAIIAALRSALEEDGQ